MVKVDFYNSTHNTDVKPTYVIIGAKYYGLWVFVKSLKRGGFELPAGHIDIDESPDYAAGRELSEETGAKTFILECINTYSVTESTGVKWGRLYFAEILKIGPIKDVGEIEEVTFMEALPDNLTFPGVQPFLFERLANL